MSGVWLVTSSSFVDEDGEKWDDDTLCACRTEDEAKKVRDLLQPHEPSQLFVSWTPIVTASKVSRMVELVISVDSEEATRERTRDLWSFDAFPFDDYTYEGRPGYTARGTDHDAVRQALAHYLATGRAST